MLQILQVRASSVGAASLWASTGTVPCFEGIDLRTLDPYF